MFKNMFKMRVHFQRGKILEEWNAIQLCILAWRNPVTEELVYHKLKFSVSDGTQYDEICPS